jgi:hypothetical protein
MDSRPFRAGLVGDRSGADRSVALIEIDGQSSFDHSGALL